MNSIIQKSDVLIPFYWETVIEEDTHTTHTATTQKRNNRSNNTSRKMDIDGELFDEALQAAVFRVTQSYQAVINYGDQVNPVLTTVVNAVLIELPHSMRDNFQHLPDLDKFAIATSIMRNIVAPENVPNEVQGGHLLNADSSSLTSDESGGTQGASSMEISTSTHNTDRTITNNMQNININEK